MHLGALGRQLEREQQTMRAHAYIVSRLVWVESKHLPPLPEFVHGTNAEASLTPEQRTDRDAAAFDAWLARVGAEKA